MKKFLCLALTIVAVITLLLLGLSAATGPPLAPNPVGITISSAMVPAPITPAAATAEVLMATGAAVVTGTAFYLGTHREGRRYWNLVLNHLFSSSAR